MHTYINLLKQLADSFKLETKTANIEKRLIESAFKNAADRKTLYIVIDEAHLLDTNTFRKLRLQFESFPKRYNAGALRAIKFTAQLIVKYQ